MTHVEGEMYVVANSVSCCHWLRKVASSSSLTNISSNTSTNLSSLELVTEQLAVNLLSANMIQIKMGLMEYS